MIEVERRAARIHGSCVPGFLQISSGHVSQTFVRVSASGVPIKAEDVARLSPLVFDHINLLGRYAFSVPDAVQRGELRSLRSPSDALDDVA